MSQRLPAIIAALTIVGLLGACAQAGRYDSRSGYEPATTTYEASDYRAAGDYRGTGDYQTTGTVQEIKVLEESSQGIGAGAVLGTIAGGLLGSQVGGGSGQTAAAVAGAAGGAYAGHELQKRYGNNVDFRITVETDDGRFLNIVQDNDPGVHIGQRVRVVDGRVMPL